MKKIFNYILVLAAAGAVFSSCKKEVEDIYVPAVPDQSDCMDVYFPNQKASGAHQLDPVDPTTVTITVARPEEKSQSAATVKFSLAQTKDGKPVDGVFEAEDIVFAAGQTETTFDLSFANTEIGVPYTCTITLEEGNYASVYTSGATQFTYGVTRIKWVELGEGLVREDMLASTSLSNYVSPKHPVLKATFYERDDMKGMYRVKGLYSPANLTSWLKPDYAEYIDGADEELYFVVDATNPKKVWIQYTHVGWQFFSNGIFYIGSLVDANESYCPTISSKKYASYVSDANYGTMVDGVITFPKNGLCYGFAEDDWWNVANTDGMTYIAIPGAVPVDYSLKLKSDLTVNGVTPIYVTTGVDVAYLKYAVYEGELNSAQAANRAAAIADGTDPSEVFNDLVINDAGNALEGILGVEAEDTGIYTLVAVAYDKDNQVQQEAFESFTYVSAENPVSVVINCGLEKTGKYAMDGNTTENSLEFYIYGEDIVDAKAGIFKYVDIASKGFEAIEETVKASKSLSSDAISAINDKGYVDIATGLIPGTEFYLVVWASNGYEQTFIYSDGATTDGDPLPIYQDYDLSNYYEDGALPGRDAIVGTTWNYYALDWYGSLGLREYLGKVDITASPTATSGPDGYGLYDEYVLLDGLFPNAVVDGPTYGYDVGDGIVEFDIYDGVMYLGTKNTFDGKSQIQMYSNTLGGWYTATFYSAFVPVADGYYAFMDVSGQGYDFCGFRIFKDYVWDAFLNALLVDPAKDDNGVAPASVQAKVAAAQKKMNDIAVSSKNFVETEKGRIQSIIDEYKNAAHNLFAPAGIEGVERTPKQVSVKVTPMAVAHPEEATAPQGAPGFLPRVAR